MDEIWFRIIIGAFTWTAFAILLVAVPVVVRLWRGRK